MNGKQAKMLRKMRCGKTEVARWKALPSDTKGMLRRFFTVNPKMVYFGFSDSLEAMHFYVKHTPQGLVEIKP